MKLTKLKIVLGIMGLFIAVPFTYLIFTLLTDDTVRLTEPVPAHEALFTKEARGKPKFIIATKAKDRQASSNYSYDDNRYNISIHSVKLLKENVLQKIIKYKNEKAGDMPGIFTSGGDFHYETKTRIKGVSTASTLNFSFSGSSIQSFFEKDNFFYAHLSYQSYGISYDDDSYYMVGEAKYDDRPASLIFMKKDGLLYTIIMNTWGNVNEIPDDLLYSLIEKP